ncbi:MAG: hypothetical protein J6Y37_14400 [Paludibacteraceae bacterium]|nr:hypothetical protein [Paludibacteraceae bacterium]
MSWYFNDMRLSHWENCGAAVPASECLKWKKWVIASGSHEIFEFFESNRAYHEDNYDLIEGE